MAQRLNKEWMEVRKMKATHEAKQPNVPQEIQLNPINESDLWSWEAFILGPPDTPYEHGRFRLKLQVPRTYPHAPPKATFITKCCHPNVHWKTGEICLDVLKDAWTPVWTLESLCRAIITLLANPEASSPLNCDVGNIIRAGLIRFALSSSFFLFLSFSFFLPLSSSFFSPSFFLFSSFPPFSSLCSGDKRGYWSLAKMCTIEYAELILPEKGETKEPPPSE